MKTSDTIDPHSLLSSKLKAFWALEQLENSENDRFTAGNIATYLVEKHGINTSRQAIEYSLKHERRAVHKTTKGYKLMEDGRKQLRQTKKEEAGAQTESGDVVMIEAGKPFSAKNIELKKICSSLTGVIYISDPYLDINTLDILFKNIHREKQIKILTQNVTDKPAGTFGRHLAELRKEGYQIEIGVYSNSELHDRYIMDDKSFWLSGNSLNHLGDKESFIVRLGEDIRESMLATFNNRWKISPKI